MQVNVLNDPRYISHVTMYLIVNSDNSKQKSTDLRFFSKYLQNKNGTENIIVSYYCLDIKYFNYDFVFHFHLKFIT